MAEAKKKASTNKEEKNNGSTKKGDKTTVQADKQEQKVNAKATKTAKKEAENKKADKQEAAEAKPANLEEPVAEETSVTQAAIDAAEQEAAVITEKRSTEPVATPEQRTTETTAKAGKRSPKALQEAADREAKEARKAETQASQEQPKAAPKQRQRTAEDRLKARGKNFRKVYELIDKTKEYTLKEAMGLATKTSPVKFDASVEMHFNLSVDPRQADQNIRGNLVLPAGTGKQVRVAVFADTDDANKAKKAGADIAGADELLADLDKGIMSFDTLIATPTMMGKLGKYARLLGPKGLMPNPKSGTVTANVTKAVEEAKAGRVEYRVDSTGIVHVAVGKVSFGADKLVQNGQAVMTSIKSAKPASVKGSYIQTIHVATSMGPSIRVSSSEL